MACALTSLEALCGFRPIEEIVTCCRRVPEFAAVIGEQPLQALAASVDSTEQERRTSLKAAFSSLMSADSALVAAQLDCLIERLEGLSEAQREEEDSLMLRLNEQYPKDIGIFSALFLNYLRLSPGEALYLAANEPHAYLSGDIVECMANSDNVVRAGLTPKLKDVDTLTSMLTYLPNKQQPMTGHIVTETDSACLRMYPSLMPEFDIKRLQAPAALCLSRQTHACWW
jgi:mannose-6-phosphate isomerase